MQYWYADAPYGADIDSRRASGIGTSGTQPQSSSRGARRARVILMLAHGDSYSTIEATVPCYRDYINRWRRRFLIDRLEGLRARYTGQPPPILTPAMEARILEKTRQPPPRWQYPLEYPEARSAAHDSSQPRR
jgi:hypothetical protein